MYDSETKEVIKNMLSENTGKHFLDSGGTSGRIWQRHQASLEKDPNFFENEPQAYFEIWNNKIEYVVISLYHWLNENLIYDPELQAQYDEFNEGSEEPYFQDMLNFADHVEQMGATGLYGDSSPMVEYTYNCENSFSQDFQFVYFELDGTSYAIIQSHNGADARGGFSAPKCFQISGHTLDSASFFMWNDFTITDGDNRWFSEGSVSSVSLENYPHDPEKEKYENIFDIELELNEKGEPISPINGEVLEVYFL